MLRKNEITSEGIDILDCSLKKANLERHDLRYRNAPPVSLGSTTAPSPPHWDSYPRHSASAFSSPTGQKKTHREEKIIKRINTPNADTTPRQPGGRTDPTLGGTPQPLNIQHAHPLSPEILIEVTPYPTASVAMYPLHGNAVSYAFT